jgi:hypothetical protein
MQQALDTGLPNAAQQAQTGLLAFANDVNTAWTNAGQLQAVITQGVATLQQLTTNT